MRFSLVRLIPAAFLLFLLYPVPVPAAGVHLTFNTVPVNVAAGDTFTVEVRVTPADAEFNAFDLFLTYNTNRLTFVPTSPVSAQRGSLMTSACSNTFHVFNPNAGNLSATLSLLCNNVFVTGPGVIYKVRFRANPDSTGMTTIACGSGTQFYRAGFFVNPLDCQPLVVNVGGTSAVPDTPVRGKPLRLLPPRPNPAHSGAGVTIAFITTVGDVFQLEMFDLSGRRVAWRPRESYAAGAHEVRWDPGPLPAGSYYLKLASESGHADFTTWTVLR